VSIIGLWAWLEVLRGWRREKGQGTVEYALVLGVIVVAVVLAMSQGTPTITSIINTALDKVKTTITSGGS
jgi:Flp pilus assembly pilin Flp